MFCRTIAPATEEPSFPDGRFDALAFRLLEGLGVREVGVVRTSLKAKDKPENFEVRFSGLVILSRAEGPRHTTPGQQGLNHLGLRQANLQAKSGGCYIVQLWDEPLVGTKPFYGSPPNFSLTKLPVLKLAPGRIS